MKLDAMLAPRALPADEFITLTKLGYGPRPGDVEQLQTQGLNNYLEEQLHPSPHPEPAVTGRLAAVQLPIKYAAKEGKYEAVDELRPLNRLDAPLEELWKLNSREVTLSRNERIRSVEEVRVATWLKAIYSKWQLQELLAEFWHNHFNVHATANERIATVFPIYDRDVIRRHALGNFRQLLEAVAQSVAMQYYLNNASSKASPANENYARELFELHTFGAEHYLNDKYDRWREVPGALQGKPVGYIDEDVYEAARSFTGWTIADGSNTGRGDKLPDTGAFFYYEGWHDNYQKRVLATEFAPNQPALTDGRQVLDLVAYHPATAQHVVAKLCRRLVADVPPTQLLKQAVATWTKAQHSPDQIAQTVRTIVNSDAFLKGYGQKVKRPFELLASFLRATGAEVTPNNALNGMLTNMGYFHFEWLAPTGHPDVAFYWLNTNMMLNRWNSVAALILQNWHKAATFNLDAHLLPPSATARLVTADWLNRLLGRVPSEATLLQLASYLAPHGKPDEPLGSLLQDQPNRLSNLVALIAMSPEFQRR